MLKLQRAESIDHFQEKVAADPLNKLARQHLFYGPARSTEVPQTWFSSEIITMHPTAEAGLPHTRPPNIICLPEWFPEEKKKETLLHEYVHLDQRNRPDIWNKKFRQDGWNRILEQEIPERWLARCRLNPDTIDQRFWAWEDRYVPLPLYEREDKPDLRQVVVQWYDMKTGARQPEPPRRFSERYGSYPSQPEHPRELAAVELAKILQSPHDIDSYLVN